MTLARRRAIDSYGSVNAYTRTHGASPAQLVSMLFEACVENMLRAAGEIERRNPEQRNRFLTKAADIVLALRDGLDSEQGGNLAANLESLYDYVLEAILYSNVHNDAERLETGRQVMVELRDAWRAGPARTTSAPALP